MIMNIRPPSKTPSPHSLLSKDVEEEMCPAMLSSNQELLPMLNLTTLPWRICGTEYHHHDGA